MKKSIILASALTVVIGFNAVTSAPTEQVAVNTVTSAGYGANASILGFGGGISSSFGASAGIVSGGISTGNNAGFSGGVSLSLLSGNVGWGQSMSVSDNLDLGEGSILNVISAGQSNSN